MWVLVPLEDAEEEGAGGYEDDLVGLHLLTILTGQGHISELIIKPQISKGGADIRLKIVPLNTQLFAKALHLKECPALNVKR